MILSKVIKKARIKKWKSNGLVVGENFGLERGSYIDSAFPWLIKIGDNVTLAPEVLVLSHDGSTKKVIGYTKIGSVVIGNNVFVGAKSIILPNTIIGDNTIVGANSVVSGNIPSNVVIAGNPAKVICTVDDFKGRHTKRLKVSKIYDNSYTRKGKIDNIKKEKMQEELKQRIGYIV